MRRPLMKPFPAILDCTGRRALHNRGESEDDHGLLTGFKGALPRDFPQPFYVARVAAAAPAAPQTIGAMIEFVDGDTPIDEAIASVR